MEQVLRMMGLVAQEKGTELTYRAEDLHGAGQPG